MVHGHDTRDGVPYGGGRWVKGFGPRRVRMEDDVL